MGAKSGRGTRAAIHAPHPLRRCEPFRDAAEAWMWTMAALRARREGGLAIRQIKAAWSGPASRTTW